MAKHIRVVIPLRETDGGDVLSAVYIGQIDNDKTSLLCHAQGLRGFLLPCSLSDLRQKNEYRQGAIFSRSFDNTMVCPGKNFITVRVDPVSYTHLRAHETP